MGPQGAADIAAAVAAGSLSAREVVMATLARITALNPRINAFTDVVADRALAQADALDSAHATGRPFGRLAGVPFAVKNMFDIAGLPTRAGSKINRDARPVAYDSVSIRRLESAGAILIGALNMGEYAYDFTGENTHDGPSRNPHALVRMSGGSSGGSAAAVAAGLVPIALGSDTNGSIRVPAALCGAFGLKPTYGRLSRAGTFPFVGSFDHVGVLGRSAADLSLAYDAMQGPDRADPICAQRPIESTTHVLENGVAGLRIAVAEGYFARQGEQDCFLAVSRAADALSASTRIELPEAAVARAAAYVITAAEGAALHRERLRTRADDFDPAVRDRLLAGLAIPAAWVIEAQRFRRWYRAQMLSLFTTVDILIAPATPCRAPFIGQTTFILDGQTLPVRPNLGIFTQPISFIGLPVVAVPVWLDDGLPLGVQIIAPPWREDLALRVAHFLERAGVARAPIASL